MLTAIAAGCGQTGRRDWCTVGVEDPGVGATSIVRRPNPLTMRGVALARIVEFLLLVASWEAVASHR